MPISPYARFGSISSDSAQTADRRHTVKGGETVQSIAAAEFPDAGYDEEAWRQIAEHNEVLDLDDLTVGTILVIPTLQPKQT